MENLEICLTAVFRLYKKRLILLLLTIKITSLRRNTASCKALGSELPALLQACRMLLAKYTSLHHHRRTLHPCGRDTEFVLAIPTSHLDTTEIETKGTSLKSSGFAVPAI